MMRRTKIMLALGMAAVAVAGLAMQAGAQGAEEAIVSSAKASGMVGEQADGYLGFAKAPSAEVKAAVDAVNIKRRQIYTELAAKQNATVQEVAAARGCEQLAKRVAPGQAYKVGGAWAVRGSAPISLPAVCG
jgi:uncharacterized protein YdbL (DUF1318 family)